jgi:hypothetical protein
MEIPERCFEVIMPQELLDVHNIGALVHQGAGVKDHDFALGGIFSFTSKRTLEVEEVETGEGGRKERV